MMAVHHLEFLKFELFGLQGREGRGVPAYQISTKSIKRFLIYRDFFSIFTLAVVRHIEFVWCLFGSPTENT